MAEQGNQPEQAKQTNRTAQTKEANGTTQAEEAIQPEQGKQINKTDQAKQPGQAGKKTSAKRFRRKKQKRKKLLAAVLALTIVGAGGYFAYNKTREAQHTSGMAEEKRTAVVMKRDIVSELSSSGTLSPKDTYEITSLVEGEVVAADFEEGDQVVQGQVLYQIDATSMESEIRSAANSLSRAQSSYADAVADYQEIQVELSGNTYKATKSGYIKELHIEAGDKIGANAQICDIYDDQVMTIRLPFLSGEADFILPGEAVYLTLTDTGEKVSGIVIAVSDWEEVLAGGTLVRYVMVDVANPGGLTTQMVATAVIGEFLCVQEAGFEPKVNTVMSAGLDSNVEVEEVLVTEGAYITKGTPIFLISPKSVEKIQKSYQDAIDKAEESVESAKNKVESTKDSYENYTITAPISGQVITKSSKLGDNISRSSNGTSAMAVIYDLSALTFEMSIDELDIRKIKVGQKVVVTADAFEGQRFSGTVTNVSLQSMASNGVTNYPVTVTLDETGDLLPGMNVDGVIILEESKDTLSIPVDSLMRGKRVYVKDESVMEAEGPVPAGFRAVEVKTGLVSDDYVEILSGLEEGQEVYVSESSQGGYNMMMPGGMGGPGGMGAPGGMGGNPGGRPSGGGPGGRP